MGDQPTDEQPSDSPVVDWRTPAPIRDAADDQAPIPPAPEAEPFSGALDPMFATTPDPVTPDPVTTPSLDAQLDAQLGGLTQVPTPLADHKPLVDPVPEPPSDPPPADPAPVDPAPSADYSGAGEDPVASMAEPNTPAEPPYAPPPRSSPPPPVDPPATSPPGAAAFDAPVPSDTPGLVAPSRRGRSSQLIGQIVVRLGFSTEEDVEAAVKQARESGRMTGRVMIDDGVLTPQELAQVLSERFGVERLDLAEFAVNSECLRLVDGAFVRRHDAIPIGYDKNGQLLLAMADPANFLAADDAAMLSGRQVKPVVAGYDDIARLSQKVGAEWDQIDTEAVDLGAESRSIDLGEDFDVNAIDANPDDAPVIKLVNGVLTKAIRRGASDIHFDPSADELRVIYRVDGMLDLATRAPKRMTMAIVSRLKLMTNMDISERRKPQDGRTTLLIDDHQIDLRVVTLPTVHGEAVICRILDSSAAPTDLTKVGLLDEDRAKIQETLMRPYGGFIVCGPTGSGKSTTLYAGLGYVNTGSRTIITIEDPVEYRLDGPKQMSVNNKAGVTFASGLRSIMRADPDIIMVGEIRDSETAHIAVESALTGHMVLSTLHTRDAPNAVARMLDMGIEPFLLSSAMDCVLAQRLARRLCESCKRPTTVSAEVMRGNGYDVDTDIDCFEPGGCAQCNDSGYRGRVGIFEVLKINDEVREIILRRGSADEIAAAGVKGGMRRLREDGLEKIKLGWTSPEEVTRVTTSG
ncbi:MAG TPA: ATPase, T2SS/T4P/T4SS family [Baekduia sp.]|nr:ATPase, T2SS/T4P/T4SS family [Baekduia sp.]